MGWLMGLEPTTTGITILTFNYLCLLIDVGTIYINQQVTGYLLDARTALVLMDMRLYTADLPTDCLQIAYRLPTDLRGCREKAS